MTNPGNTVRVRARNGGRASVYEANAWAQTFQMGLLAGSGVTQNTSADMNVLVGGSTSKPDVVVAQNPAGYKIALDLVNQQLLTITAPATNSRIAAIVAYTDDLSLTSTDTTTTGSPSSCGLIVVNGASSANPVEPTESEIRTAITADGATGSQAAYAIIATVVVEAGTTIITNSLITNKSAKFTVSTVTVAGETWTKREYPDGTIKYVLNQNYSLTVPGGSPGYTSTSLALPTTFDPEKMSISALGMSNDQAVSVGHWFAANDDHISVKLTNHWASNLTVAVHEHIEITVYPD